MGIRFDLEELNPFTRFYFNDDAPEEGWIELRQMAPDEQKRINAKTVKVKVEIVKGNRFSYIDTDPKWAKKANDMTWAYCIGDWLMFDKNNQEIPATTENKIKIMGGSVFMVQFVSEKIKLLNEMSPMPTAEEEEKN